MAQKTRLTAPLMQGIDKKSKKDGLLHGLLTILMSILIVLIVFGGAFYYVLRNNIAGLGEHFRPGIERVPVLKLALPPLPDTEDPYDPKHLTQKEVLVKYNELRNINKELNEQLKNSNNRITELENEKNQWVAIKEEALAIQQKNDETLKQIQEQMEQLKNDKKEIDRLIAEENPDGFARYYEKVDAINAQELYKEIIEEEAVRQDIKNLAKPYEEMEPANAAAILTELGSKDIELTVNLIDAMKNDVKAEIIENMEPDFAAEIMKNIASKKLSDKTN